MGKMLLIANKPLVIQILENSESKLLFNSAEYVLLFICIITALLIMMLIPALLCYSMIDNFFKIRKYNKEINTKVCTSGNNQNSEFSKCICDKYLNSYSNFMKNSLGFAAWNIFSIIYIVTGFKSFKTGLIEYFNFPFNVFNTINENAILNSLTGFSSNWYAMLTIIALTFIFTLLGKYLGSTFGRQKINKRGLSLSIG
jgi:hypothetical protein